LPCGRAGLRGNSAYAVPIWLGGSLFVSLIIVVVLKVVLATFGITAFTATPDQQD
jgi:hypothetical protein